MEKLKIALVQMDSGEDRTANLQMAERMIKEAKEQGAKFVILPETSDYIGLDFAGHAISEESDVIGFFKDQAVKHQIYLHLGSITEAQPNGRPKNTSFVIDPKGEIIGRYSKLHLFDVELEDGPSYLESDDVTAGDKITCVEIEGWKAGLSICYDLRFPELYRIETLQGATLLINSANFTANTGKDHWEILVRARAIENTCYVAAVCQCGQKSKFEAWGHSMAVDPWGRIVGSLEQKPGVLVIELDPECVVQARKQIPCLKNRRADIYQ